MSVRIRVPGILVAKTGGPTEIDVEAGTVAQALQQLEARLPALQPLLRSAEGGLRAQVQVYVNDVHVRFRQGIETPLRDGDLVYVVPLVMGG